MSTSSSIRSAAISCALLQCDEKGGDVALLCRSAKST